MYMWHRAIRVAGLYVWHRMSMCLWVGDAQNRPVPCVRISGVPHTNVTGCHVVIIRQLNLSLAFVWSYRG
jgi:hypothetical protein